MILLLKIGFLQLTMPFMAENIPLLYEFDLILIIQMFGFI